jgi:hypothetical protein
MIAIHAAVVRSGGSDDYTGEELAWEKTYDNAKSKEGPPPVQEVIGQYTDG